jgi:hypothetical protein
MEGITFVRTKADFSMYDFTDLPTFQNAKPGHFKI